MQGRPNHYRGGVLFTMDKREFLKTSGAALTGCILSRMLPAQTQSAPRTNWAGNYTYSAPNLLEPHSTEQVQAAVRERRHLRALGSRHSFNAISDSTENQISLHALNSIDLDVAAKTVTVGAGVRYGDLAPGIDARGFALHNLASLPHISVAVAIATATHGSGLHNGNLSTAASALEFVNSSGDVVHLTRASDSEKFSGAAVHLGALGILTRVTLDVQAHPLVAAGHKHGFAADHARELGRGTGGGVVNRSSTVRLSVTIDFGNTPPLDLGLWTLAEY